jgi:cell division protein ZapD
LRDLPTIAARHPQPGRALPRGARVSTLLTFEHPLNERIRVFMRIEHLFERLDHFAPQFDTWASRVAVETLIELASVTARADVRNEIINDLERQMGVLQRMADKPGVDAGALEEVLGDLAKAIAGLNRLHTPIGQTAREDELLKGIAQRIAIPGGSCSFDLPTFHHWLTRPPEARQARLEQWLQDLRPAEQAIGLILDLTRGSAIPREVVATDGFFQEALDVHAPAQMLRVGVSTSAAIYPEISGHKGRFSIRFMTTATEGRPTQITEALPFKLTCCIF